MKSPFPGMDPYLERHWRDVHQSLCVYARDAIQPQVMPALLARVDERLVVETFADDNRSIYPDVRVVKRDRSGGVGTLIRSEATKPLLITTGETVEEGFIRITDPADGNRIVTVIEFLSKSNKDGDEGEQIYRKKAAESIGAGANLVEIDLLRTGGWVVQVVPGLLRREVRSAPYKVCVLRATRKDRREFYPITLRDRLPTIQIPLRSKDADAVLDLQSVFDKAYGNGGYETLDYSKPLTPPLDKPTPPGRRRSLRRQSRPQLESRKANEPRRRRERREDRIVSSPRSLRLCGST